jgi:hypothetical protein
VSDRDLPGPARALAWFTALVVLFGWIRVMPGRDDFSIGTGLPTFIVSFSVGWVLAVAVHDVMAGAFRRIKGRAR